MFLRKISQTRLWAMFTAEIPALDWDWAQSPEYWSCKHKAQSQVPRIYIKKGLGLVGLWRFSGWQDPGQWGILSLKIRKMVPEAWSLRLSSGLCTNPNTCKHESTHRYTRQTGFDTVTYIVYPLIFCDLRFSYQPLNTDNIPHKPFYSPFS